MDSVTQAVLGATVTDACLGKTLGRKAAWWGLLFGTLPDLDVLAKPLMHASDYLQWHRGLSHSLLVTILAPILLTLLLRTIYGTTTISLRRGYLACFLAWSTHVLIDCITVYGTGLWEPFSDDWIEYGLLFIIDPLYTLPLLLATLPALSIPADRRWRPWCTGIALALSTAYIGWAAVAKTIINDRFHNEIQVAGIEALRWQTAPTMANTFLWRCVVTEEREGELGHWVGYASLWDHTSHVHWRWVSAQADLLNNEQSTQAIKAIQWYSMGYWIVRRDEQGLALADLRFGETTMTVADIEGAQQPWFFKWYLNDDPTDSVRTDLFYPDDYSPSAMWYRIWGRRFAWESNVKR